MKISFTKVGVLLAGLFLGQSAMAQTCPAEPDAWSNKREDVEGMLTITSPGLAGTSCQMDVKSTANGGSGGDRARVQYRTAAAEPSFRYRFFLNISSAVATGLSDNSNRRIKVFNAQCRTANGPCPNTGIVQFRLQGDGAGNVILRSFTRRVSTTLTGTKERFDIPLQTGENIIELQLVMGSAPGTNDGVFRVWVNQCSEGSPDIEFASLDNAGWTGVGQFNTGVITATNAWASNLEPEIISIDEVEARRSTYIGGCTT